jgi:mannose-6-phosphate isomerase-like protein (cupin superfamily)
VSKPGQSPQLMRGPLGRLLKDSTDNKAPGGSMGQLHAIARHLGAVVAPLGILAMTCSPAPRRSVPSVGRSDLSTGRGLILQAAEGERRVRRPPPSPVTTLAAPLIIKVDRRQGGSPDFFMGYENIPVGRAIAAHRHPDMDEILFVHRGRGHASVGGTEADVSAGTTIYVPRDTRVSLQNTGAEPLTILFIFPNPDMAEYFRDFSVLEGKPAVPFTTEEFTSLRARYRSHVILE